MHLEQRILVTGGSGFLGSHLCERLLEKGAEVICLDNFFTGVRRNIEHLLDHKRFELIRHDVTFPIYLEIDQIYNLACPASPIYYQHDPVQTTKTSVHGAINMLGLAKRVKARVLQASTSEVYGDPEVHPQPESKSAATLVRLKALFKAEFGEEPFLAIDRAFFQDPATPDVADAQFRWNTFQGGDLSHSDMKGVTFDHFMTKWDTVGRDNNGRLATANDQIIKGPALLDKYLAASESANLVMMATWNDLGEGTGLTRNYDYYYQGEWLPPNAFMGRIRASQCR